MSVISFIVIGRNEGWKLTNCLNSVVTTIAHNELKNCEIIYVDSDSTDDSTERAKVFDGIRIFKITGKYNAAIARNTGAQESRGDVLFFIDGDMEIQADFLPLVYNDVNGLADDFVSGQFVNYYYDYDGTLISKNIYHDPGKDVRVFTTGGLFLINRHLWSRVDGMKNKLRTNEDTDLGIRLAGIGVLLKRKKELLAIHHTISYHHHKRTWEMLLGGSELYRSVLMRDNLFNYYQWKLFMRENYTGIVLMILLPIYFKVQEPQILIIYLVTILLRILRKKESMAVKLNLLAYYIARDFIIWVSLLFFWPSNTVKSSYKRIR